jgi:hypothetical protein
MREFDLQQAEFSNQIRFSHTSSEPNKRWMKCPWQQREKNATRVLLDHGRFVGDIWSLIYWADAQDVPFGLDCAPEMRGSIIDRRRYDDGFDRGIGEDLLGIANELRT